MSSRLQRITAVIGVIGASILTAGAALANPVITNIQLVSQTRIDRNIIEATYRADAKSTGGAFRLVSATVSSTNPATTIIDNSLSFPDVGDGATVTSTDTFTIRHDLRTPFENSFLSFQVNATLVIANRPPVANAGPDQTKALGTTATLNGSGSSDPDGNPLTFSWTLTNKPSGSTTVLAGANTVSPSFIIDRPGNYMVSLVVNDGALNSVADSVTVSTSNSAPVANAGPDQTVLTGGLVTLNGSGSSDADGNPLTFTWTILTAPAGSTATLSNPGAVMPTFTADKFGAYVIRLLVNDGSLNSTPDTVTVNTSNSAPIANAGPDQTALVGATVHLNGSLSSDVDGQPLTFAWSISSAPAGSSSTLSNAAAVTPTITITKPGTYVIQLIVNDGIVNSAADTMMITTLNSAPVANAGPDQTVNVGNQVTLNGSGSSDVDGNPLTFAWSLTTRPAGSAAVLSSTTAVMPTFVADVAGQYIAQLIVNDGTVNSATDTVVINTGNSPPVANAGPDQTVNAGTLVTLNGSASSDVDGNPLTFAWSFTSRPSGSTAVLSNASAVMPTFTADKLGDFVVQLIVNDGTVNSAADTVKVTTANSAPTANAGPDQTVGIGKLVTLTGLGSSDPEGGPLTYAWSLTRPAGSSAVLSSTTSATPTFTADLPGNYVAQLIVNDGFLSSPPDTVTISTVNVPPVANAGPDQTVSVGAAVSLNGSASSDADGQPLTYSWSFTSKPSGSTAVLSNATVVAPTFTADLPGTYVVQLIVGDSITNSAPDSVTIITQNRAPTADAGPDASVEVKKAIELSGTASSDPDGDPLTYAWSITSAPSGSTATLVNPTSSTPSLTPDLAGAYTIRLIVNDGKLSSTPDTVIVTATPPSDGGALINGGMQTGSIDLPAEIDTWTFTATAGDRIAVHIGEIVDHNDFRPWIQLKAPNGTLLGSSSGVAAAAIDAALATVTGTYSVLVGSFDSGFDGTGTYRLSMTHTPGPVTVAAGDQGGPMTNGAMHIGEILTGDMDVWTFTANAGDRIGVHIGQITDNNDFRPWIRLWAPNGAVLSSQSGTDAAAIDGALAPVTGTYLVLVASFDSGFDGSGTYRLTMTHTPGPITVSTGDEGGPLTNGALHTGEILKGDLDVWTFTANVGDRIAVHVGQITDNDDFRPWIRLWSPTGAILASQSGTDAAAIDGVAAPVTGTYLVLVGSFDSGFDGSGRYRLTMTHTPGPITVTTGDEGGPLTNGAMHTGELLKGDLDVWTFTANVGDRIGIHIGEITDNDDFRPWIRLWSPTGQILASQSGTDAAAIDGVAAPVTGTYLVLVGSFDSGFDGSGTYRLTMTHTGGPITVSAGDEGGPLTNGAMHTGEIPQGDLDVWTFTATAGDRIGIHIGQITDTDDFRPWIRLWSPTGQILASQSGTDAAAIDGVAAPLTGTYLVLVGSFDSGFDGTGTYRLTMTHTPGPITVTTGDQGGPLTNGAMHTGEILKGDLDVWTFTANVGDRIGIHIGEITDNDDFRPWIRLWSPTGQILASQSGTDAAAIDGVAAPVTGTYLVLVGSFDSGFDGSGTYRLTMTHTGGPITVSAGDDGGPLTNGAMHTGEILQGDLDVWTFTATAGDRIGIHIGEITDTDDFRPWIRLWSPTGQILASQSGTDAAAIDGVAAPLTGTYLVLVGSFDSGFDGTGTYRLTMAHTPGPITVVAGDQGGALTNFAAHAGEIVQGDLDVWTINAVAGQRISVQITETSETDDFRPWIRVWAPNGAIVGSQSGVTTALINSALAPVTGTYLVLVSSFDSGFDGTGTYSLTPSVVNP